MLKGSKWFWTLSFLVSADVFALEDDIMNLSIEQLSQLTVSSASLFEDSIAQAPSSVTIFTHSEIQRLGFERLSQLMNFVPGYQSHHGDSASVNSDFSARHYSSAASGPEILILLDGQRINSDWNGGIGSIQADMWLDNVDRIEFIRGPGSAIYGSNAVTGVVNIITRGEKALKASAGSFGKRSASAQWSLGEGSEALNIYARGGKRSGESLYVYNSVADQMQWTKDPYEDQEFYVNGKINGFNAQARWVKVNNSEYYVSGLVQNDLNYYDTKSHYVRLGYDYAWSDALSLESHIYNTDNQMQARSKPLNLDFLIYQGGYAEAEKGINQVLRYQSGSDRFLLGWELRRPFLYDSTVHAYGPINLNVDLVPNEPRLIRGLFSEWQTQLTAASSVLLAARYDGYSDFGSHVSPRVAYIYKLDDIDTLKAMYAEAFRAPSRLEYASANNPTYRGNPDLMPEIMKNSELVWVHGAQAHYFSVTLYHNQLTDVITPVQTKPKTWVNGNSIAWNGIEFEWQHRWNEWGIRHALSQAFDSDNEENAQSDRVVSAALFYNQKRWDASLTAVYQSAQYQLYTTQANPALQQSAELGGKTFFGANVNYQLQPELTVSAHLENLFDRHYLSSAESGTQDGYGVPQPGRSLVFSVDWRP